MSVFISSLVCPRSAAAGEPARDEISYGDAQAWAKTEPEKPWATPKSSIHADRLDFGGTLIPSLSLPILLTDPFSVKNAPAPASSTPSIGYGLEWRLGYAFGRLSVEAIGGFSRVSRDSVRLSTGRDVDLALSRAWGGGQARYVLTVADRIVPFVGAGFTLEGWTIDTIFRPDGKYVFADTTFAPAVHAMGGTFVRLFKIGDTATVFGEIGAKVQVAFATDVADSGQLFLTPYLGFSVQAARRPVAPGARRGPR